MCDVLHVMCYVLRVPCSGFRVMCSMFRVPCSMLFVIYLLYMFQSFGFCYLLSVICHMSCVIMLRCENVKMLKS